MTDHEPRSFRTEENLDEEQKILLSLREEIARARERVRAFRRTMESDNTSGNDSNERGR